MKRFIAFFQDNALFYKDITQWLRNRTFTSLFFGLLLVAEALSLFIIAGSDQVQNPGVAMFYTLFQVLFFYAVIIAFFGNSLTSREFSNRTIELIELTGMSLESMIGGKLLSMLYQFFFGFFCLVPFMFFAYFLGGLDFIEMLVGIVGICLLALPVYLVSLGGALKRKSKQLTGLARFALLPVVAFFLLFSLGGFFSGSSFLQYPVRELTKIFKEMLQGSLWYWFWFVSILAVYVQFCLLIFYYNCDAISRETDSREIPIKVLVLTLLVSWLGFRFAVVRHYGGSGTSSAFITVIPVLFTLLILGLRSYYSPATVPPIIARRYENASALRRIFYAVFKPGVEGGVRTMILLVGIGVAGTYLCYLMGAGSYKDDWLNCMSLLVQVPWFLTFPHFLYARSKNLRRNFQGQRTLTVVSWVILGSLVLVFEAWVHSYNSYGSKEVDALDVILATVLSPLSSAVLTGSSDPIAISLGMVLRMATGFFGVYLMIRTQYAVIKDEGVMAEEAEAHLAERRAINEAGASPMRTLDAIQSPEEPA